MSILQVLKCDGDRCGRMITTKPPMEPTPSNLRLQGGQEGWVHQCRKDYCPMCSLKMVKPKKRRSRS